MNTTTANTSPAASLDHVTTPTTRTDGGTRHLSRIVVALLAALIAVVGSVALSSTSASAYVNTAWSGRTAPIRWGYTGGAIAVRPGFSFMTPVMIVYRNGAVQEDWQQEVSVRWDLQIYSGGRWVNLGSTHFRTLTGPASDDPAVIDSMQLVSPLRRAGHYRVATTVSWGIASALPYWSGRYTGHQQFVPSALRDFRCISTQCRVFAGSVYVAG
jgi:hypothetical protein